MSRTHRQRAVIERHVAARKAEAARNTTAKPTRARAAKRRLHLAVAAAGAAAFISAAWRAAFGGAS